MSRSRKKHPHSKICNASDKADRRDANRRLRRVNKIRLRQGKRLKSLREVSDTWMFASDGLAYYMGEYVKQDPSIVRK